MHDLLFQNSEGARELIETLIGVDGVPFQLRRADRDPDG